MGGCLKGAADLSIPEPRDPHHVVCVPHMRRCTCVPVPCPVGWGQSRSAGQEPAELTPAVFIRHRRSATWTSRERLPRRHEAPIRASIRSSRCRRVLGWMWRESAVSWSGAAVFVERPRREDQLRSPPLVVAQERPQLCSQQLSGEGAVHRSEQHSGGTQGGPVRCLAVAREGLQCTEDGVGFGVGGGQPGKSGDWF